MSIVALPARSEARRRLADETFDVVVVGGGITGAGVALDSVTRGFRTAIVEARDWASGTSSKSSKLVHGGLRYLQQKEFGLVGEALKERTRLLANAPHLVTRMAFLIPLFGVAGATSEALAKGYSAALTLYDKIGRVDSAMRHRRIPVDEVHALVAGIDTERIGAAFVYHDAQADDARLTLAIVGTAVRHGAVACNDARVVARAPGGVALDDGRFVRARCVVNATGVWATEVMALDDEPTHRLRPAKGVHLSFDNARIGASVAVVLPARRDKRSVFLVPHGLHQVYLGTTDTPYEGPLDRILVDPEDTEYLLSALNDWLVDPVTEADITGSWAGVRPLLEGVRSARTADLSRRHTVVRSSSGLVSILGGKLTTYRLMAEDTVDEVAKVLDKKRTQCVTANLAIDELAPPTAAWAVDHEQAITVADVLERRCPTTLYDRARALVEAPQVADVLGAKLGWTETQRAEQLRAFEQSAGMT